MSLFCSISGTQPLHPVVSTKSGHVYERDLVLKALKDNDGKDPISGEQLSPEDLVDIKTGQSASPSLRTPAGSVRTSARGPSPPPEGVLRTRCITTTEEHAH